ncbi:hypothetical protein NG751_02125 [Aliarcobacter cryaerophilus]|uniref:hypothetical protein n=1 Tax=Aliarcobacter cryaerophilus TaxID=28198 RepID=UPI003DA68275
METNSKMRYYKFYFEDENGKECTEEIVTQALDEAKRLFSDSFPSFPTSSWECILKFNISL